MDPELKAIRAAGCYTNPFIGTTFGPTPEELKEQRKEFHAKVHATRQARQARQTRQTRQEIDDMIEDVIEASCFTNPWIGTKFGPPLDHVQKQQKKYNEMKTTKLVSKK